MVRAVSKSGDAQVGAHLHNVVILDTRHRLPAMCKALGIEIAGDGVEIHRGALALRRLLDRGADGAAQSIVLQNVKARAATGGWGHDQGAWPRIIVELERPILGILEQPWLDVAKRVGEIAAKAPAGILIHG